jgi:uncharacterized membrane protein
LVEAHDQALACSGTNPDDTRSEVPMAPQIKTLAAGLTGAISCVSANGFFAGVSQPAREGWLVHATTVTALQPGVREVLPAAVDATGRVVGKVGDATDGRAFLFDGQMRDLQSQLGTSIGEARGLTDAGVVVGARARVAEPRRAFRLDLATGEVIAIPFAAGLSDEYVTSIAVAVTADGRHAIGLAAKAFSVEGHGFLYDHETGVTTDLGADFFPRAINNRGVVAGMQPNSLDVFTLDLATGQRDRRGHGLVEGLNDEGVVVGSMSASHPDFSTTPFFGRPGQGLVDASTVAAPGSLRFSSVSDVSEDGQLVGSATVDDPSTGGPLKDPAGGRQTVPATLSIN